MNIATLCTCLTIFYCYSFLKNALDKRIGLNTYLLDTSSQKLKKVRGYDRFIEWSEKGDSISLNINNGPLYYPDKLYYSSNSLMIRESKSLFELRNDALWFPKGDTFLKFTQNSTPWVLKDYFGYRQLTIALNGASYDTFLTDTVFHFVITGEKKMGHYDFITDLYFSKCNGIIRMDYDVNFSGEKLVVLADFYDTSESRRKILESFLDNTREDKK
ncbi:hypothetical protein C900_02188 [Fulvivirga imtechensis AK7]|uniref:Uncharacterized protein n=1 Tax=Fulvivirga imtechensis AK7 TaxID=1237149 RepID=L8JU98_9BACT|nr:hypothetical protein [Fulvivirga imtechensis]ELR71813.1 hypothetical protein C900_02188 [Fulvivirga imtechensis AK7]